MVYYLIDYLSGVNNSGTKSGTSFKFVSAIGLTFIVPYLFGWFFPDMWWGTHFIAFVPEYLQWSIVLAGILILLLAKYGNLQTIESKIQLTTGKVRHFLPYFFALAATIFYWQTPLVLDIYGDAYRFNEVLNDTVHNIPKQAIEDIFSLRFAPWDGELTILGILAHLSYFLQVTWGQLFEGMSILFGGLFAFIYTRFVLNKITSVGWQTVLILGGLVSPYTLIFHQHYEIYAPIYFFQFLWFIQVTAFNDKPSRKSFGWLIFLTLINLKLHTITVLMFPALLLVTLRGYFPHLKWVAANINWKGVAQWVFVPISIVGTAVYFFVFQDHMDDRSLQTTAFEYDHLFLPVFSPDPPLNGYNILSFNHVFDYVNLIFHGTPIAFMVVVYLGILRKEHFKNNLNILLIGTTTILYFALFFVVNPLLSMPRDWDLLNMTVPGLLVLSITMIQKVEATTSSKWFLTFSSIIAIFSSCIFFVNTGPKEMAKRIESLIVWNHSTYYEWTTLLSRYRMQVETLPAREEVVIRNRIISSLKPNGIPAIDREYAAILRDQGFTLFKELKDPAAALPFLEEAFYYFPDLKPNIQLLVEVHFSLGTYKEAYQYAVELVDHEFPSASRALSMAIHCALEAERYEEAEVHCLQYLRLESDNQTINTILNRLRSKQKVDQLKYLFRKPPPEG